MTLLSSVLASAEHLLSGLFVFVAPDMFMNPDDGLLRSVSCVRETSLETNHIDPINSIKMMAYGAGLLSFAGAQFLASSRLDKRALLTSKLYLETLTLLALLHTLFNMEETSMLNPTFVGFFAGVAATDILWLADDILHFFKAKEDDVPRTPAKASHLATVVLSLLYVTFYGISNIFRPEAFAPDGPMAFYEKTPLEDGVTLDEVAVVHSKLEGAVLLAYAFSMLELLVFDRSVERIRWNNTFALVSGMLYLVVFCRAVLDTSGYVKNRKFLQTILVHCVSMWFTLRFGPTVPLFKKLQDKIKPQEKERPVKKSQ